MKNLFTILLFFIPVVTFAQCEKCRSFDEAQKDPEMVRSLQINPWFTKTRLKEFPKDLNRYPNLQELFITDHGLTSVPVEIGELKSLRSLSLAGNELTTLPEAIFELKKLEELILMDNAFSEEYKAELKRKVKKKLPATRLLID